MTAKKSRLFAIDVEVYRKFRHNCTKLLGVSMSSTVEGLMIEHNEEVEIHTETVNEHKDGQSED